VARGHTLRVPRGGPGQGFARGVGIAGARPGQCGVRARSRGERKRREKEIGRRKKERKNEKGKEERRNGEKGNRERESERAGVLAPARFAAVTAAGRPHARDARMLRKENEGRDHGRIQCRFGDSGN
jgi:hypothetical protein